VTGNSAGGVWGNHVYTDDSNLATAAVHAGILFPGQTRSVNATIYHGQGYYPASMGSYGLMNSAWGVWPRSYIVEAAPDADALSDPGNLRAYSGLLGQSFLFQVTPTLIGAVWGTGEYTDDSMLATAVHAGILGFAQTGVVMVTILPGQNEFPSSFQNDVLSSHRGAWACSYMVEAVPA
jgi:LCCL domain